MNTENWNKYEKLEFNNETIQSIDLNQYSKVSDEYDFNTQLTFINCKIGYFNSSTLLLNKKISFINCKIDTLNCYSTYFFGGFLLENCIISNKSTFDSGGHNRMQNPFIIKDCIFEEYLEFFDIYFSGPVKIKNNNFKEGTNIAKYLVYTSGIKEGITFEIDNNKGKLNIENE